jgi:hypothetical protein
LERVAVVDRVGAVAEAAGDAVDRVVAEGLVKCCVTGIVVGVAFREA